MMQEKDKLGDPIVRYHFGLHDGPKGFLVPVPYSPEGYAAIQAEEAASRDAELNAITALRKQQYTESTFNDKAKSGAGAMGAFQIMPNTLQGYVNATGDSGDIYDYEYNKRVRDYVLSGLEKSGTITKGNPSDTVRNAKLYAGYNWGVGNLGNMLQRQKDAGVDIYNSLNWIDSLPAETKRYVDFLVLGKEFPGTKYTNDKFHEAWKKRYPEEYDTLFSAQKEEIPEAPALQANWELGKGWIVEPEYATGGKIHIKPENRGKFTALTMPTNVTSPSYFANGGNLFWPGGKKKSLFDKDKVLNRVYGDGQAFAEGNGGITSSVLEYLFNDDDAVEKRIKDAELGARKYEDVLKSGNPDLVYKTFRDLPKEEQRLFELGRMVDVIKQHEDAKRIYLGYEPKYGQVERAKYRPTIGNSEEPYQVNPLLTDGEFNNLIVPLWSQWKTGIGQNIPVSEGYLGLKYTQKPRVENKGNVALVKNLPFISDATMSIGFDDKGQYLSLYDIWDYNTNVIGTPGDNVGKHIGGKPFEIYQRYYLDDRFDIPESERGYPYIAPAYVTAEKAHGGKIHIRPSKRGTFTAAAKKRGKSVQGFASQVLAHKENYSPAMVKKANFARNSAKWHGDGGIIDRLYNHSGGDVNKMLELIQKARSA